MLAAAANATATPAPGRLHRFTNGFSQRPFRYPAHASGVAGYRKFFVSSNRCWLADGFRRGVRRGKDGGLDGGRLPRPRRCRSSRGRTRTALAVVFSNFRFRHFPGGFTERTLALRSPDAGASLVAHRLTSRQVSALFRWPDSSICARSTRCRYTDYVDRSRSFRRPQTAETGKDSGAPKIPEAARLRPASRIISARGVACRRGPQQ
jgi:hypothetical protein